MATARGTVTVGWETAMSMFEPDPYEWWTNFFSLGMLMIGSHIIAFVLLSIFGKRV